MTDATTLTVSLGGRSYDIVVGAGLLAGAGTRLGDLLPRPWTVVVTDETVADLHLPALAEALEDAGIEHRAIVLPPGEETKTFATLEGLLDALLEARVERTDVVLALGGGVIGDLAGFAASVLRRGVDLVQIPTTLLAQVDSAVGGKTGINTRHGKNLVGSFHQPRLVMADVSVLDTLPERELLAGYAEVVKYGLLGDARFFAWLERHGKDLRAGDSTLRQHAVLTCCRTKARIVAADERESGERTLLNLGHTFAHALEAETGFAPSLLHGEAVAIGMVLAFELSVRLGLCPPEDAGRVRRHLAEAGLPTRPIPRAERPRASAHALVGHMLQDKKARDGRPTFVLVRGIGEAFASRSVDVADVTAVLESELAA